MKAMQQDARAGKYFSSFGGLWIDRSDFAGQLQRRLDAGELAQQEADDLEFYEANGYVVFKGAVDPALCDDYAEAFKQIWTDPPPTLWASLGGRIVAFDPAQYERIVKVADFHYYYPRAVEILYPPRVLRFLELIYERAPVVFQTMTVRKGTEEPLHTDTGPLSLTEPMSLVASWLALEDVQPGSGELQFVPRSHRVPEQLVNGRKAHLGDMHAYHQSLEALKAECEERDYGVQQFMAKKGDVLIWAADLLHGGKPIENAELSRKSLIAHFMPQGVMPTFYDHSDVDTVAYGNGAYCLNRYKPAEVNYYHRKPGPLKSLQRQLGVIKQRANLFYRYLRRPG